MAEHKSIVICGGAFAGLALAVALRQGLGTTVPVVVADGLPRRLRRAARRGLLVRPDGVVAEVGTAGVARGAGWVLPAPAPSSAQAS